MYLFTLFYDNILHIFNIADIWLHVKLIICTYLLCFCVKYILFLNLTTYLLVITIEEQFKVILYIQVSDAIAFCRLPQKRYRTVVKRSDIRNYILHRQGIGKSHFPKKPKSFCLYFYRIMRKERRYVKDTGFPPFFLLSQCSKFFV